MADTLKAKQKVRLRGQDFPLDIALCSENRGEVRVSLPPGRTVEVDPDVYDFLKLKFGVQEEREVTNVVMTPTGPIKETRSEAKPGYIIEFMGD